MKKIGIIGDIHYPYRNKVFPEDILRWFKKENVDIVIGTGDYSSIETINKIKKNFKFIGVIGNTDDLIIDLPKYQILEIEGLKIGVTHSKEIYPRGDVFQLYNLAKKWKVDILIFGHTHIPKYEIVGDDIYQVVLINPGSAGGVISGEGIKTPRSAAVLKLVKNKINNIKFRFF